jgi:hypothetical protein
MDKESQDTDKSEESSETTDSDEEVSENKDILIEKTEPDTAIPKKKEETPQVDPTEAKKSDTFFIYAIIFIVITFLMVIFIPKLIPHSEPTIQSLFADNFKGKLNPEEGYMYNDVFNFIYFDGLWYTQLANPAKTKIFTIPFHYGPRNVDNISISGYLNGTIFNMHDSIYMTFYPIDSDLQYIAVGISETNAILVNTFGKKVQAACTVNETIACQTRPIIQCNSTSSPVFYFKYSEKTSVQYKNNCVIISGSGTEIWKATDRMLFDLLDVIKKE